VAVDGVPHGHATQGGPVSFTCPKCAAISHHPQDEQYGYCANCHEFTGPQHTKDGITVTDAERKRILELMEEATAKVAAFRDGFSSDSKGMMLFIAALYTICELFPGLMQRSVRGPELLAQWVIAGEPEDVKGVPEKIRERRRKEGANA
jgi:hypothetical protein